MSGHLCLKWNNHSLAFLKGIATIQIKEKYCDATIACQGKYFPVHRVILSTCSDYFDEIFERMECPHPYIVFKDIAPEEMGLLLNYMYQGEINVVQEKLPSLIKAAEALKVKGLAIPDDLPAQEESQPSRKRKTTSTDNSEAKRRTEESRRSRRSSLSSETDVVNEHENIDGGFSENIKDPLIQIIESQPIKEEPVEPSEFASALKVTEGSGGNENHTLSREDIYYNKPEDEHSFVKSEEPCASDESYENQTAWPDFTNAGSTSLPNMSASEMRPEDIFGPFTVAESVQDAARQWNIASTSQVNQMNNKRYANGTFLYQCEYCEYSTNSSYKLKRHSRVHTGEKPFQCEQCFRRFSDNSSLNKHTRRKYACQKYIDTAVGLPYD